MAMQEISPSKSRGVVPSASCGALLLPLLLLLLLLHCLPAWCRGWFPPLVCQLLAAPAVVAFACCKSQGILRSRESALPKLLRTL
eukprot:7088466-Karenia_brevis.AAC.1